jgi:hypothetical protein
MLASAMTIGCSDGLSPESRLGTWELVTVNGAPVPGRVTMVGEEVAVLHWRYHLLTILHETPDGGSDGECREEIATSRETRSNDDCMYTFDNTAPAALRIRIDSTSDAELIFALDGTEAVLLGIRTGDSGFGVVDTLVFKKR